MVVQVATWTCYRYVLGEIGTIINLQSLNFVPVKWFANRNTIYYINTVGPLLTKLIGFGSCFVT